MADISKVKLPDNVTYNLKDSGAVRKTGDTMTGQLVIKGSAASKPLKVRGIVGTNGGDGTTEDVLYLQYGNTTYDTVYFGNTGGGSISSNGTQYSGNAATATKATQDGSGNTITSTYVKKSGDTITGELKLYREGTTTQNVGTYLYFQNKDTTTGKTSTGYIGVYNGGEYGSNFVISPQGNMFIGSGEAAQNHYDLYTHHDGKSFFATADSTMYLQANGQTIANRVGIAITTDHALIPIKADVGTNNIGSIGTSSYKWANGYFTNINGVAVGDSPKFTDTNNAVEQTVTTANANYEVLFSVTADNTTRTEGARKNSNLTFNPSTGTLTTKILMPNNTYDATWIKCGQNPNIYINNTKAAPWLTGNTKNGRIVHMQIMMISYILTIGQIPL